LLTGLLSRLWERNSFLAAADSCMSAEIIYTAHRLNLQYKTAAGMRIFSRCLSFRFYSLAVTKSGYDDVVTEPEHRAGKSGCGFDEGEKI